MHSFASYCCLLVWSIVCALTAPAGTVRVATYNVRNYLVMDRMVAGTWRPDYPKPEAEKAIVREVIQQVRPDILLLQEMGTVAFLEELRADLTREGLHYPYAVHLAGPDSSRHIAMLSMVPPHEVVKHRDLEFKYFEGRDLVKRGMLEVTFLDADGAPYTIFGVHLKSRWTEHPDDAESGIRRTREAEACRNRIIDRTLERGQERFMIAGDFNDHPGSAPLRRFYRRGDLMIGSMLPAMDSRGEVWTYFYGKEATYQAVDGLLLSPALAPLVKGGVGQIYDGVQASLGSDHRMVTADLVFGGADGELTPE